MVNGCVRLCSVSAMKISLLAIALVACVCHGKQIVIKQPCELVLVIQATKNINDADFESMMTMVRSIMNYVKVSESGLRIGIGVHTRSVSGASVDLTGDEYKLRNAQFDRRFGPAGGGSGKIEHGLNAASRILGKARWRVPRYVILVTDGLTTEEKPGSESWTLNQIRHISDQLWNTHSATVFVVTFGEAYRDDPAASLIDNVIARDKRRVLHYWDIGTMVKQMPEQLIRLIFCEFMPICHYDKATKCIQGWYLPVIIDPPCSITYTPTRGSNLRCKINDCDETCNAWPWQEAITCTDANAGVNTIKRKPSPYKPPYDPYENCPDKTKTTVCPTKEATKAPPTKTTKAPPPRPKPVTTTKAPVPVPKPPTTTKPPSRPAPPKKTLKPQKPEDSTAAVPEDPNEPEPVAPGMSTLGAGGISESNSNKIGLWGWGIALLVLIILLLLLLLLVAVLVSRSRRKRAEKNRRPSGDHRNRKSRSGFLPPRKSKDVGPRYIVASERPSRSSATASKTGRPQYVSAGTGRGSRTAKSSTSGRSMELAFDPALKSKKVAKKNPQAKFPNSAPTLSPAFDDGRDLKTAKNISKTRTKHGPSTPRSRATSTAHSSDTRAPTVKTLGTSTGVTSATTHRTKQSRNLTSKSSALGPTSAESVDFRPRQDKFKKSGKTVGSSTDGTTKKGDKRRNVM